MRIQLIRQYVSIQNIDIEKYKKNLVIGFVFIPNKFILDFNLCLNQLVCIPIHDFLCLLPMDVVILVLF